MVMMLMMAFTIIVMLCAAMMTFFHVHYFLGSSSPVMLRPVLKLLLNSEILPTASHLLNPPNGFSCLCILLVFTSTLGVGEYYPKEVIKNAMLPSWALDRSCY